MERSSNLLARIGVVLVIAAAVSAAAFGWSWWKAATDALRYSRTRDAVLRAGEQAIQNLNTLDYRTAEQGAVHLGAVDHRRPARPARVAPHPAG